MVKLFKHQDEFRFLNASNRKCWVDPNMHTTWIEFDMTEQKN